VLDLVSKLYKHAFYRHRLSSCEIGLNCPVDHFSISSQSSCSHFTSNSANSIEAYRTLRNRIELYTQSSKCRHVE